MYKLTNLTDCVYDLDRFGPSCGLADFLHQNGLDGLELMRCAPQGPPPPSRLVYGVHLTFPSSWMAFFSGDLEAVKREFFSLERAYSEYGGSSPRCLEESLRRQLDDAQNIGAKYAVLHVTDVGMRECITKCSQSKFDYTDMQVVSAMVKLVNAVMKPEDTVELLFENLWWPGLNYLDPAVTSALMEGVDYPYKGLILDTGHLMHTCLELETQAQAVDYCLDRLKEHGALVKYIRGVHLNQSLTGALVKAGLDAQPPLCGGYDQQLTQTFTHIFQVDRHLPFSDGSAARLLEVIRPQYCVYEFITKSLEEHNGYIATQNKALGALEDI